METRYEVRHISVFINRSPEEVYRFTSNPENLPRWATGLGDSIKKSGHVWIADSPMGTIKIKFAENNLFGVLDHDVTSASGETFHNPVRVIPNGSGSEVIFTLFRQPGMSHEKFSQDAQWVEKDLNLLRDILEK